MKLIVFILIILFITPKAYSSEKCNSIKISAHPNYPPFHWEEYGQLKGASIDISKQIFERLGLNVEIQYVGPWKRVLINAEKGKIDFIPALKNSPERKKYLHFTQVEFSPNPVAILPVKVRCNRLPLCLISLVSLAV